MVELVETPLVEPVETPLVEPVETPLVEPVETLRSAATRQASAAVLQFSVGWASAFRDAARRAGGTRLSEWRHAHAEQ
ncbi:hypothetical protein [Microterricola viridarii]|uniref:hypothetical protein n=1 Tax=Microterricola viridarii TaxID=412690 RepID=UPI0013967138|nr:hypothetical protein [Microterricola viridarii]